MNAESETARPKRPSPFRLAAVVVSFSCLMVAATAFLQLTLVDHFAIEHATGQAELRLQQLSWQMRDALDRTLDQAIRDVSLLSSLPQLRQPGDTAATRGILEQLQHQYPDYAWIGIARPDGKILAATGGLLENRNITARPWFHTGQQAVSLHDYHPAVLLGKLLPPASDPWRFVDIAGPIHGADGTLQGVLAIHLSWHWARTLARELLTPAQRGSGAEILLVRDDGMVLLGPDKLLETRIATSSLSLARQGRTGALTERWPDGGVYVTGYSRSSHARAPEGLQWSVLVRQTEQAAMASAHTFERRAFWLSVGLAALLASLAALLARRIVKPLKLLSAAIERAAQAPDKAVPESIPATADFHESRVLSDALRGLMASERQHCDALEQMNAQLERTVAARTAELQEMLMRDVLTGLPNRRALMQALQEALARSARLDKPCAVLFLDIDGFKQINDTFGHDEGDALLRQFAARIRDSVRGTDMAARLAGDEFVVILDLLSDGEDAANKAGLLARAEQAMYEARRKGRNRSAAACEEPAA